MASKRRSDRTSRESGRAGTTDRRRTISRRLKAARALAGLTVTELAVEEVQANGITASLIGETERQERDARPMELEVLARACGLPEPWFTASYDRLAEPDSVIAAVDARLARIEGALGIADQAASRAFEREIERGVEEHLAATAGTAQTRRTKGNREGAR